MFCSRTHRYRPVLSGADDGLGRQSQQTRADAPTLVPVGNMQVVEQRPPSRVVVEHGIGEAEQVAVLGEDRATARVGLAQPVGPNRQPVGDDVTIEKTVGVGAAVVTSPAVSVKICDGLSIGGASEAEP